MKTSSEQWTTASITTTTTFIFIYVNKNRNTTPEFHHTKTYSYTSVTQTYTYKQKEKDTTTATTHINNKTICECIHITHTVSRIHSIAIGIKKESPYTLVWYTKRESVRRYMRRNDQHRKVHHCCWFYFSVWRSVVWSGSVLYSCLVFLFKNHLLFNTLHYITLLYVQQLVFSFICLFVWLKNIIQLVTNRK